MKYISLPLLLIFFIAHSALDDQSDIFTAEVENCFQTEGDLDGIPLRPDGLSQIASKPYKKSKKSQLPAPTHRKGQTEFASKMGEIHIPARNLAEWKSLKLLDIKPRAPPIFFS